MMSNQHDLVKQWKKIPQQEYINESTILTPIFKKWCYNVVFVNMYIQ